MYFTKLLKGANKGGAAYSLEERVEQNLHPSDWSFFSKPNSVFLVLKYFIFFLNLPKENVDLLFEDKAHFGNAFVSQTEAKWWCTPRHRPC